MILTHEGFFLRNGGQLNRPPERMRPVFFFGLDLAGGWEAHSDAGI